MCRFPCLTVILNLVTGQIIQYVTRGVPGGQITRTVLWPPYIAAAMVNLAEVPDFEILIGPIQF